LPEGITDAGGKDAPLPVRILDSRLVIGPAPVCSAPGAAGSRRAFVALRIENPNPDVAAEGLGLTLRLLDGEGAPLAETEVAVAYLLPAELRNVIVESPLAPVSLDDVATVDAAVGEPSAWRRVPGVPSLGVQLRPAGFRGIDGLYILNGVCALTGPGSPLMDLDLTVARATVTNPLDVGMPDVEAAAVAFDQEGRIVGSGARRVALGSRASTEVFVNLTLGVPLNDVARVEVTAVYVGLDLGSYER
jgi:hypothetical protein